MSFHAPLLPKPKKASSDVARVNSSSTHINHTTQSLIDIDANTELLNGIMRSGHTDQSDVAWHHHIGNVEATESDQLLQGGTTLEDSSDDYGVNATAETDVDVLERRVRFASVEDVDESAEIDVTARRDV
jgi:hypothetical protein